MSGSWLRVVILWLQVLDEALMRYYTNNQSYQIHVTNHPTPISDATKASKTPHPYCYKHSYREMVFFLAVLRSQNRNWKWSLAESAVLARARVRVGIDDICRLRPRPEVVDYALAKVDILAEQVSMSPENNKEINTINEKWTAGLKCIESVLCCLNFIWFSVSTATLMSVNKF